MVGQVVAGAVAPVVVQSATSEDGLINKLFKIGVLLAVLLIIGVSVAILLFFSDIGETARNVVGGGFTLLGGSLPIGLGIPFRLIGLGLTGLGSAFAFRRS